MPVHPRAESSTESASLALLAVPTVYVKDDLAGLVGKTLPAQSILVGRFMYLGKIKGLDVFTGFITHAGAHVAFDNILVTVHFHGNFPSGLKAKQVIEPNAQNPLILKSVMRTPNGFIIADTDFLGP